MDRRVKAWPHVNDKVRVCYLSYLHVTHEEDYQGGKHMMITWYQPEYRNGKIAAIRIVAKDEFPMFSAPLVEDETRWFTLEILW